MGNEITNRKDAHLELCLRKSSEAAGIATGLGRYTLEHDALCETNFQDVDLSTTVLTKKLRAPLIIGAMTGGTERAAQINKSLARAATRVGVGMALGSQRAMLGQPELKHTFAVREFAPDLPLLFGNIGAVQLNLGVGPNDISRLVDAVNADAIFFHLNPLQEAIQPGGDTCFAGLSKKLEQIIPQLPVPSLIKEVGAGISARAAKKLAKLPLAGVEVAGVGGTSFALVESLRAEPGSPQAVVGQRLAGFGIPTAASIQACRQAFGNRLVIASGGIRTGMDIAVAIALGADIVAMARPLLEAAVKSEDDVVQFLETLVYELAVICFCTGSKNLEELRKVRVLDRSGLAVNP
ncbi:MAG: type 2 isopentenyl-diphosphate Delta-isomerase [Pseudomonadota bacterium]